ncbi:acyltransferase, WS/DGAT/MGAT [Kribbella flavida DSM 17836]|uniref:Diacylglycerol O-acyltransferase n=1 Tax=Kribbella flavida (strain DSM 17836 / JCM 10339 / NBRC 14399) TaxID=479435 RepID=D2PX29_KRIFD|nr:wax ester/triacylglycerol synthase family O-acyltransferase [Kribbella flavida]ADB35409.1 acyltransferase, WS/DGAT/MGAT [Kribbella flavida DSM 17836]
MTAVGPLDALFLLGEGRDQPMHVGGLLLFELPEGAGQDFVSGLYQDMLAARAVNAVFARRVRQRAVDLGYWSWEPEDDVDLEYHVRLSALPRPGRYRELFELTSRLHGTLLDRRRPLWEMYLIEGVEQRRFALYSKIHHSMLDGVSALRLLQAMLSTDPDRTGMPAPYALPGAGENAPGGATVASVGRAEQKPPLARVAQTAAGVGRAAGGAGRFVAELAGLSSVGMRNAVRAQQSPGAFQAPRTILNQPITGARRFAAQSWARDRLENVRASTGATLNDVMLGMCGGALRSYLLELNALPDKGLTAMVPVSLRGTAADGPGGGNSLATLIADLATDEPDAERRIRRTMESTSHGKAVLSELSPLQNLMIGALGMGSAGPAAVLPGLAGRTPPPYNLVISNVPGPVENPLYWNGSRLLGMYPASVVLNGQALNISVTSYDRQLHFGLTGSRRTVPHLQRLLGHLESALQDLERV